MRNKPLFVARTDFGSSHLHFEHKSVHVVKKSTKIHNIVLRYLDRNADLIYN